MAEVLNSQEEIDRRIYVFPASAVEEHGVKIPYFDFISSLRCPECNDALRRVTARINFGRKVRAGADFYNRDVPP